MIKSEDFPKEWNAWFRDIRQEAYEPTGLDRIMGRVWRPYAEGEMRTLDLSRDADDREDTLPDEGIRFLRVLFYSPEWFGPSSIRNYIRDPARWPMLEEVDFVPPYYPCETKVEILVNIGWRVKMVDIMRCTIDFLNQPSPHRLTWVTMDDEYRRFVEMDRIGLERFTFKVFEKSRLRNETYYQFQERLLKMGPPRTAYREPKHILAPDPWDPLLFQYQHRVQQIVFLGRAPPSERYLKHLTKVCPKVLVVVLDRRNINDPLLKHFKVFVTKNGDPGSTREMHVNDLAVQAKWGAVMNVSGGLERDLDGIEEKEEVSSGEEADIDRLWNQINLLEEESE